MFQRRLGHTASLLLDERVLLAGGVSGPGLYPVAEIFDPSTGAVSALPAMVHPRKYATAVPLGGGRVLSAGGDDESGSAVESEVFVYDRIMAGTFD